MSDRIEREVPRMPPFTTLEALQREHDKLLKRPRPKMRDREWHEYLAEVLPVRDPDSYGAPK